jgi:hypothetical protein
VGTYRFFLRYRLASSRRSFSPASGVSVNRRAQVGTYRVFFRCWIGRAARHPVPCSPVSGVSVNRRAQVGTYLVFSTLLDAASSLSAHVCFHVCPPVRPSGARVRRRVGGGGLGETAVMGPPGVCHFVFRSVVALRVSLAGFCAGRQRECAGRYLHTFFSSVRVGAGAALSSSSGTVMRVNTKR